MATVTRRDRLVDLVALCCILAGAALYLDGTARLRAISGFSYRNPGPAGVRQLDLADRARYESNGGMAVIALGALVGVASWVRVHRRPSAT